MPPRPSRRQSRRRSIVATALAALPVTVLVAPAATASAEPAAARTVSSVTIEGRAFGHGIGMSQYGARNRAADGQSWQQILSFYYRGTSLGKASGSIRVRIEADTSADVVVAARSGLRVRSLGDKHTWALPERRSGARIDRWRITPSAGGARSRISYRTGSWHTWKSPRGDAEFSARGKPVTLLTPSGRTAYRGALRSASAHPGRDTVNVLPLDAYVRGVVAKESFPSWPAAALRAQAVAARSYAAYERAHAPSGRAYDLCDTTSCQVYGGVPAEVGTTDAAVRATSRRVLRHGGGPALTMFSSSNGGWTARGNLPYLQARRDRFDHGDPNDPWRVRFTASEITRHWAGLGRLESVRVVERDGHGSYGGRAVQVRVTGSSSSVTVSGATLMSYLGLRSTMFRIT